MELATVKALRWTAAVTGLPALLAGLGSRTVVEFVVVVLIVVLAGCRLYRWTVKDPDRTDRSIKLIEAFRGSTRPPRR